MKTKGKKHKVYKPKAKLHLSKRPRKNFFHGSKNAVGRGGYGYTSTTDGGGM